MSDCTNDVPHVNVQNGDSEIVVVDYLQLMSSDPKVESIQEKVSKFSRGSYSF